MPALSVLAIKIADEVFGYLFSVAIEESGADAALRQRLRERLGKKSPEQLAFQMAVERALKGLEKEHPGWSVSLFDETLLTGKTAAGELSKCLWREGKPDDRALARAWAQNAGTDRADLQEAAQKVAATFIALLEKELDATDVRPALAPLRTSRDLNTLIEGVTTLADRGEVLQGLVEEVLQRLDAQTDLLASQSQILEVAAQQGLLRVEKSVTVHGNVSRAIIITGDGNKITVQMTPELLKLLTNASPDGRMAAIHKNYLQRLLEQDWTTVSMSLFAPQDPNLAKRVKLSDIYTPLPVRFELTLKFDKKGRLVDWWSGRELTIEQDEEIRAMAAYARGIMHEERGKLRTWPEMSANEDDLRPLVIILERELRELVNVRPSQDFDKEEEGYTTFTVKPDACHAALVRRRFVLVGDPGSGKSTFLRHLALSWAGELLKRMGDGRHRGVSNLPGQPKAYTPIYIELRSLPFPDLPANQNQVADMPGVSFFREYLQSYLSNETIDFLFELLRDEDAKAAILLDGLDEIPQADDARRRGQVHALVNALAAEFPDAPIIIAARPYAYRQSEWQLEGFGRTELAPLPRDRQVQLAERLFTQIAWRRAEEETRAFANALQTVPEDLASNPLLLTLLAAIWVRRKEGERELPRKRGELYRRGLMLLLEDWVRQKRRDFSIEKNLRLSAEDLRLVLQLVAAYAQEKRQSVDEDPVITEGDIFVALRAIGRGDVADDLVNHLEGLAGVLQELAEKTPGAMISPFTKRFRFLHQSFQEYLAACEYLYSSEQERPHHLPIPDFRRFPDGLITKALNSPDLWNNVLRLAVDELFHQERGDDAWELLSGMVQPYLEDANDHPLAHQAALLALDIAAREGLFASYDRKRDRKLRGFYEDLQKAARKALTDVKRFPDPEQRDIAGRLLGQDPFPGHDPRPGVGVKEGLPDFDWVRIPAGEFIYQDGEPRYEEAFWITRYPVTRAQFETFLRAEDGFYNPEWWEGLSADEDDRARPGEQAFEYWNHPRERVSWYDAIAFSRWLTAKAKGRPDLLPPELRGKQSGWRITLPTEWQWERAARGTDGRQYPWGSEYKSGYANVDEKNSAAGPYYLEKTSAVGMYPQGKSPDGVLDMSGNVWEWCLKEYDQPERVQETGDASRVLRGGSWGPYLHGASAVYRYWVIPDPGLRSYDLGFRLVVSVPH